MSESTKMPRSGTEETGVGTNRKRRWHTQVMLSMRTGWEHVSDGEQEP